MAEFEKSEKFPAPEDLTVVSDEDLQALETEGVTEFDAVHSLTEYTPDLVAYAMTLREDLDRIKAELSARKVRAEQSAAAAKTRAERQMAELAEAVHGPAEGTPEGAAHAAQLTAEREDAIAAAAAKGAAAAMIQVLAESRMGANLTEAGARAVASLSATREVAPKPKAPAAKLAITAAGSGAQINNLADLGSRFTDTAQGAPVTSLGRHAPRYPVAKIRNDFAVTMDNRANPYEVLEAWREMVQAHGNAGALVAAGGWCAPNEIMYDFFNIAGTPRMIDLPTIGVTRGGLQWPVSPAIGDVFFQAGGSNPASGFGGFAFSFANTSDPWLWTETDDILTVTGSVNKPTLRVPCSTFTSGRLEAYGLTVTAGNLTDSAYPEQTQNFLQLIRAAYAHAINARLITLMVNASAAAVNIGHANSAALPQILNATGLAAADYRNRYAMDEDAVLEIVFPFWILEALRADLGYKPGLADPGLAAVADATITGLFTSRNVRPQFVSDWQVRGTGLPGVSTNDLAVWPTSVTFMLYAAGTFLHGQGMSLDLGVVRDSTLNAENDHTAAWAEETHMIALVGHASRRYTVAFDVGGDVAIGVSASTQTTRV